MFFRIRPQTFLVASEKEKFFFKSFERRVLVQTSQGARLEEIWLSLKNTQDSKNHKSSSSKNYSEEQLKILALLERYGLIERWESSAPSFEGTLNHPWSSFIKNCFPAPHAQVDAISRFDSFQIQIVTSNNCQILQTWKDLGFNIKPDAPFVILIAQEWEGKFIEDFNRQMCAAKKNWLPVIINSRGGKIGPFLGPQGKICWNCITHRRKEHLENPDHFIPYEQYSGDGPSDSDLHSYHISIVQQLAQLEVVKLAIGQDENSHQLLDFDIFSPSMDSHVLWPSSTCECFYAWD